ncbi:hypothetical protein D3C73_204840 [compost metagenome]
MRHSNLSIKQLAPYTAKQPEWQIPASVDTEMFAVYATYPGDNDDQVYVSGYLSPGQKLDLENMEAAYPANVCITRKWIRKGKTVALSTPNNNAPLYLETLGHLVERVGNDDRPFYFNNRLGNYKDDDFKPNDPVAVFALKVTRALIGDLIVNNLLSGEFRMQSGSWDAISVGTVGTMSYMGIAAMLDKLEVLPDVRLNIQTSVGGETLVYVNNGRSGTYRWPTFLL